MYYPFPRTWRTVFLIAILSHLSSSRASIVVWTNTSGGLWSALTNWNPNSVPGAGDTAFITNSGTYTVTMDVAATLASLTLGGTNGIQTLSNPSQTLTLNAVSQAGTNAVF